MFETSYSCNNMYQLNKCHRNTEYFALLVRTLSQIIQNVKMHFTDHLKQLLCTVIDSKRHWHDRHVRSMTGRFLILDGH